MNAAWYRFVLGIICIASFGLNLSKLRHNLEQPGPPGKEFWNAGTDTACYLYNASALFSGRPLITVFKERLTLPFFLKLAGYFGENPKAYLYMVQGLHILFPLIIASCSRVLFRNRFLALISAVLYVLYQPASVYSQTILTDFLHAFFFVSAITATIWFFRSYGWPAMGASAFLFMCAMLSRPTFLFAGLLITPVIFLYRQIEKLKTHQFITFALLLLAPPLGLSLSNIARFGVFTPTFNSIENIHTVLVPGLATLIRKSVEVNRNSALIWHEERDLKAMQDPIYKELRLWEASVPEDKNAFRQNFQKLRQRNAAFVKEHFDVFISLLVGEASRMLLLADTFHAWGRHGRSLLTFAGSISLVYLFTAYRQRGSALILSVCCAWIVISSSTFLWATQRFMLPVDLLLIVLAPACFSSPMRATIFGASIVLFKCLNSLVYAPLWNYLAICGVCAIALTLLLNRYNPRSVRKWNALRGFRYARL